MVKKRRATWDGAAVRALREHMSLTQQELSDELGVRQQTISEWETCRYRPRGPSARLLGIVAERAGFVYGAASPETSRPSKGFEASVDVSTGENAGADEATGPDAEQRQRTDAEPWPR